MRKIFLKKDKKKSLERKYKRLQVEFIMLFIIFLFTLYCNYDYLLFKVLIAGNYIYTDTLDEIYNEQIGEYNIKNYFKHFDDVVITLFTDKIREKNKDNYTYLYSPEQYDYSQDYIEKQAMNSKIEELNKNTIYVKVTNFSTYTRKFLYDNVKTLKNYKNIILDLRDNPGGDLPQTYKIADLFLPKGNIIAYENARFPLFSSKNISKNTQKLKYDKIYILQNENSASASEVLINALKENIDNVTLIGSTTFGKGIGQAEFNLKNGYVIKATVITVETPIRNSIHKKGITPEIEYKQDDIINYTLSLTY